ncbi:UNVERIFIED_CONTAM: Very-long-chain enoyl-CoA reductase [Sesamum radiatum]|uniref:Very-long-chain enoyl-CoA reductase n=1 Tax=Sesamum radiatum TaxID=300843 RepID=A0AAW2TG52_SESRA
MVLNTVLFISSTYLTSAASMIYFLHRVQGLPEPSVDLKYVGLLVFVVGIVGNFYHHYLLSKLRDKNDKGYTIPRGGLFSLVICPHYLFEILTFIGFSLISQTFRSCAPLDQLHIYLLGAAPPENGIIPSSRISLRMLEL